MEVSDAVMDALRRLLGTPSWASDTGRTGEMNRHKAAGPFAYGIAMVIDLCVARDDVAAPYSSLQAEHSRDEETSYSRCAHLS